MRRTARQTRKLTVLMGLIGGAAVVFGLVMITRPAVVIGVGGGALHHSVRSEMPESGVPFDYWCDRGGASEWTCAIPDRGSSSTTGYRVEVDWLGCWDAYQSGSAPSEGGTTASASGCINSLDAARPFERLLQTAMPFS